MLWIIIPTFNEADNIGSLVPAIFALGLDVKIVVVDDNSPDGTGPVADQLAAKYNIEIIHRAQKLGLGSAYLAGFAVALAGGAEFIMEMDADWSHDPKDISKLLQAVIAGADLAIGSRRVLGGKIVGWGPIRRFMSRLASDFARIVLSLKTRDVTAGFRCYRRSLLEKILLNEINSSGYSFQEELIYWAERLAADIQEVPVVFNDRELGKSKLSMTEIIKFFYMMMVLKWKDVKRNN